MNATVAWDERSKSERKKIRDEMLVQANLILKGLYPSPSQRRAAARKMVDQAISKERSTKEQ